MTKTATELTCECGRTFDKKMGLHVHSRQCAVEKRRSDVHVDGFAGLRGWPAVYAWREAGRP